LSYFFVSYTTLAYSLGGTFCLGGRLRASEKEIQANWKSVPLSELSLLRAQHHGKEGNCMSQCGFELRNAINVTE
jgi:hypothetical protein